MSFSLPWLGPNRCYRSQNNRQQDFSFLACLCFFHEGRIKELLKRKRTKRKPTSWVWLTLRKTAKVNLGTLEGNACSGNCKQELRFWNITPLRGGAHTWALPGDEDTIHAADAEANICRCADVCFHAAFLSWSVLLGGTVSALWRQQGIYPYTQPVTSPDLPPPPTRFILVAAEWRSKMKSSRLLTSFHSSPPSVHFISGERGLQPDVIGCLLQYKGLFESLRTNPTMLDPAAPQMCSTSRQACYSQNMYLHK